jgi:hypothetical protein
VAEKEVVVGAVIAVHFALVFGLQSSIASRSITADKTRKKLLNVY